MMSMTKRTMTMAAMALMSALALHVQVAAQTPALPTIDQGTG